MILFFRMSWVAYVWLIEEKQKLYYWMLVLSFTTISYVFTIFLSASCL